MPLQRSRRQRGADKRGCQAVFRDYLPRYACISSTAASISVWERKVDRDLEHDESSTASERVRWFPSTVCPFTYLASVDAATVRREDISGQAGSLSMIRALAIWVD